MAKRQRPAQWTGRRIVNWLYVLSPLCFLSPLPSLALVGYVPERPTTDVGWNFSSGLEGWGSTSSQMGVQVSATGQVMSGTVTGTLVSQDSGSPHIDSPRFAIDANDRHHVVLRMSHSGRSSVGRVSLRTGTASEGGFAEAWGRASDVAGGATTTAPAFHGTVLADVSSSGNASAGADSDEYSVWRTDSSSHEYLTLDLQEAHTVSRIRITAAGGRTNPANVRLLQGPSSGASSGSKFHTVANLTMSNSTGTQAFTVPETTARFWRLYIVDGHGSSAIEIGEVELLGTGGETFDLDFDLQPGGTGMSTYYLPIVDRYRGPVTQLRLFPAGVEKKPVDESGWGSSSSAPVKGDRFEVDYVGIERAPHVYRVEGCIDRYHATRPAAAYVSGAVDAYLSTENGAAAVSNISSADMWINSALRVGRTTFHRDMDSKFATTFNCLREGGEVLTISGTDFGSGGGVNGAGSGAALSPTVTLDGLPCTHVNVTLTGRQLTCVTPQRSQGGQAVSLVVSNGALPGLMHSVPYVSFARGPAQMRVPRVTNIAARSVDIVWAPPPGLWEALSTTGYQIGWRNIDLDMASLEDGIEGEEELQEWWERYRNPDTAFVVPSEGGQGSSSGGVEVMSEVVSHLMTVGNVTTTTVRGLQADTRYIFWIRALSENQSDAQVTELDLYGRREVVGAAAVGDTGFGAFSAPTNVSATLSADILTTAFNANATVNHSSSSSSSSSRSGSGSDSWGASGEHATDSPSSLGPRGMWGGEGHYGLALVGTTHVQNCNRTMSCCDAWNGSDEPCSSSTSSTSSSSSSSGSGSGSSNSESLGCAASDGIDWASVLGRTNVVGPEAATEEASALAVADYSLLRAWGFEAQARCGDRLRLTGSQATSIGAGWYARKMTVGEGFDTTFTFEMSTPSLLCKDMDRTYTHCRSRGGDGLAFVIHNSLKGMKALGDGGMGLGYGGIDNSLAVEFDTTYNAELGEPYENHVSVHTSGFRSETVPHQRTSLGATTLVPDLTDGPRRVRIRYTPRFSFFSSVDGDGRGGGGGGGGGVEGLLFSSEAFQSTAWSAHFLENADFPEGGQADWGAAGLGLLSVFVDDVDDVSEPKLVVPLNLEHTLQLEHGRAYVGFTAATGTRVFQTHDILAWELTATREEVERWSPPLVGGEGAHACGHVGECVHS